MRERSDPFSGLRPSPPPPELRDRTLRAARNASRHAEHRGAVDRLWESTLLRWAWLAAVAILLLLNLVAVDGGRRSAGGRASVARHTVEDPELLAWPVRSGAPSPHRLSRGARDLDL